LLNSQTFMSLNKNCIDCLFQIKKKKLYTFIKHVNNIIVGF